MAPDPPGDPSANPSAVPSGGRSEDQPGWAAPSLPPTEPITAPLSPPGMPAAPSPGWAPAAPQPRSRRWVVVLVAVLALTVAAAVAGTVLFVDRTLPPYNAAHDFITDVIHDRTSSATARLCASDRENAQRAIESVRNTFGLGVTTITVNVLSVDRTDDRATVDYDVSTPNAPTTYHLEMRKEGGSWKACPGVGLR